MRLLAVAVSATCALAFAGSALADSGKLKVAPFTFDPNATGSIVSEWQSGVGLADAGKSDHGLVLQKNAPTSTLSAAGARVTGAEGQELESLAFDIAGDCGAGSPRFNVVDDDGDTHFFGCIHGAAAPVAGEPDWTRRSFGPGTPFAGWDAGDTIARILIIADEQGQSVVDNVSVNGVSVGKPGNSR